LAELIRRISQVGAQKVKIAVAGSVERGVLRILILASRQISKKWNFYDPVNWLLGLFE
jgi:hypothetical protein